MKKNIRVQVVNPAGNITIFVHDEVPRSKYASVGKQLLEESGLGAEQVAFITGPRSIEMSGMEFCGNATRSFALLRAIEENAGACSITVQTSGVSEPLVVDVDPENDWARVHMQLPKRILETEDGSKLVDLEGIMHLIKTDVPPSIVAFEELRDPICSEYDPEAMGVMFLKEMPYGTHITPYVYVRDVNSVYEEGSCATGSVAAAIELSLGKPDGEYEYEMRQPDGTLIARTTVADGSVKAVSIEGKVLFDSIVMAEVDM